MEAHPYERELTAAISAVTDATGLCRAVQSQITAEVLSKKDKSPVTVADYGSQAIICRALGESFPDDPIVAEEDAASLREPANASLLQRVADHVRASPAEVCDWIDRGGCEAYRDRFWTLDPIDGTKGFLRREQYAIALALIIDGEPVVAALACPNLDGGAIFTAVRGRGAHRVAPSSQPQPVHVSPTRDPTAARFCESVESGHSAHGESAAVAAALGITTPPLRMDSQCKYAVVASGQADIYMRLPTRADYIERIWDHAAGALIVAEAGGTVTDIHGRPLNFRHGRGLDANRGILATNGLLHDRVLQALKPTM